MPYGKIKTGKDKPKPPFSKDPGRVTIMPVPKPGKPGRPDVGIGLPDEFSRRGGPKPPSKPAFQVPAKGNGRKIGRPVPPKKVK